MISVKLCPNGTGRKSVQVMTFEFALNLRFVSIWPPMKNLHCMDELACIADISKHWDIVTYF